MAEFVEIMKQKKRMCKEIACAFCEIGNDCMSGQDCIGYIVENPERAEEIIMQWACEHPIKTNADKFKEIINEAFGEGIVSTYATGCSFIKCPHPELICDSCEYRNFWNKEYKEPKKEDK